MSSRSEIDMKAVQEVQRLKAEVDFLRRRLAEIQEDKGYTAAQLREQLKKVEEAGGLNEPIEVRVRFGNARLPFRITGFGRYEDTGRMVIDVGSNTE